jgi:hypothetical protein
MIDTPGPHPSGGAVSTRPRLYTVTRLFVFTPALLLAAGLCSARVQAQHDEAEYALKAAFVSKFPHFAEWPDSAIANRSTIDLCVAKPNPFGDALGALVAGERLAERPLRLRYIDDADSLPSCHVLFVPTRPSVDRKALLTRAAALPILTVGDYDSFLDEGGIVKLLLIDGRVRFEVDVASAGRAGLHLSSQLLQLALSVRGGPR